MVISDTLMSINVSYRSHKLPSTSLDFRFAVFDGIPELLASRGSSRGEGKGVAVARLHRTLHVRSGGGNGRNGTFGEVDILTNKEECV
ncbi:hypothetical protein ACFX2C_020735 [Malus domestica]